MQAITTSYTIAEYCGQLSRGEIVVNSDYQRSEKVWPPAARSYLIDTILLGYPIPKLTLYQKTDVLSRQTIKEIVDGQQRSQALCNFLGNRYRLSVRSPNGGKKYAQLAEADQRRFLEYNLSADILVAATESEIRQLFRRINSYTVPLNDQETRHAVFQGALKWFIVELSDQYSQALKGIGVFSERQLTRMQDAQLFAEICLALEQGIQTSKPEAISALYRDHENEYPAADETRDRFDDALGKILSWIPLHRGPLMRPYNFYALTLALMHKANPVEAFQQVYRAQAPQPVDSDVALTNLGVLADAIENPSDEHPLSTFIAAAAQATNVREQREERFRWFSIALEPRLIG